MNSNLTEEEKARIRSYLPSTTRHIPIEAKELAERFSSEVWEKFGNSTSESLINLWTKVFESFNEVWLRNQAPHIFDKKNIIIPAPTGSGKTLCMRFYAAAIADKNDLGMMIITKLKSEAKEAAEQINKWSESVDTVAVAYHSNSSFRQNEEMLKDFPILIITHENFTRNHHSKSNNHSIYKKLTKFKDGERTCIVVDESIELIKHIGISKDLIDSLSKEMREPYTDRPKDGLEDEYRLLSFCSHNYNNLFFRDTPKRMFTHIGSNKETLLDRLVDELGLSKDNVIELFKLKETTSLVGGNTPNIDNIQYLLDDSLYIYKSGGKTEYRTSSLEVPAKSMVALDATANVNKAYEHYKDTAVVILPKIKTYENVTIKTHKTESGLGKNTLVGQTTDEDKSNIHAINLFFMDKEESVIFTFKDLKGDILKELTEIDIDHFGNLIGINKYKNKEHIIIYGMHYKPQYVHFDEQYQALGMDVFHLDNKDKEELKNSGIAADIIQMINRGRGRGVTDTNKAPHMTVDLPLPNNKSLKETILEEIKKEMPGINIIEATSLLKTKGNILNRPKKAIGKDKLFIDNININEDRVKVSELFKTINASKKDKERIVKHIGKSEYKDSYLNLTLKDMGYSAVKEGQWYLVKDYKQ